jgi:RP/EB family microtubule-associated protein
VQQHFQPSFSKVEECCSGVVYCQIIGSIYPGSIAMSKVKMNAKTEVDFIHNFKLLQTAFSKKRVDRFIDVDKLTKKSFQFNMEFLQFMKCYWDMHAPNGTPPENFEENQPANQPSPASAQPPARKAPAAEKKPATMSAGAKRAKPQQVEAARASLGAPAGAMSSAQQQEVNELKESVENLERERDFYYSKLREVEVLCQANEGSQVAFLQEVLEILYKTDDHDEFVTPDPEAEEVGVEPIAAQ